MANQISDTISIVSKAFLVIRGICHCSVLVLKVAKSFYYRNIYKNNTPGKVILQDDNQNLSNIFQQNKNLSNLNCMHSDRARLGISEFNHFYLMQRTMEYYFENLTGKRGA